MRPKEFVARVIDLFEFDFSPWEALRPDTLSQAHMQIIMSSASDESVKSGYKKLDDGVFVYVLQADCALGHSVIRASMSPVDQQDNELTANICFTFENYDDELSACFLDEDRADRMLESWFLPTYFRENSEMIIEMIAYLTLKTTYRITRTK